MPKLSTLLRVSVSLSLLAITPCCATDAIPPAVASSASTATSTGTGSEVDILSNVNTVKACLTKNQAQKYDYTSNNGFHYATAGRIDCMNGQQIGGGHEKFVLYGVPALDASGQRLKSKGDSYFPNSVTITDQDADVIAAQIAGHSYYAVFENGKFLSFDRQNQKKADTVREGPPAGTAGTMHLVRLTGLPATTLQTLNEIAASAEQIRVFTFGSPGQ